MQKMRIVMLDSKFPKYRNPFVNALTKSGVDVTVIAPYNREDAEVIENAKWLTPLMRPRHHFYFKPLWIVHRYKIIIDNILKSDKFIKSLKPSLIHMQGVPFPLFEFIFGKSFNIPKVVTVHNVIPHEEYLYNYRGILKKVYQTKGFDAFIVHSERCKEMLCSFFPSIRERIFIISFGCHVAKIIPKDEARAKLGLTINDYPLILFFGGIRKYKGLIYLLKSLPLLVKKFYNIKLVIAGRVMYDKLERYMKVINSENLEKKVILRIGYIPEKDVDLYFQAADITVLPYTAFTSQSGVLLRAYSNQSPVVVTDTGALGETVKRDITGVVVRPSSVEDIAEGIIKILSDRKIQETAKKNMAMLVREKYNWMSIAQETVILYNRILRGRV